MTYALTRPMMASTVAAARPTPISVATSTFPRSVTG